MPQAQVQAQVRQRMQSNAYELKDSGMHEAEVLMGSLDSLMWSLVDPCLKRPEHEN